MIPLLGARPPYWSKTSATYCRAGLPMDRSNYSIWLGRSNYSLIRANLIAKRTVMLHGRSSQNQEINANFGFVIFKFFRFRLTIWGLLCSFMHATCRYNPGQNYVGQACRITASTIDQFFTWKQTFFGPNPTFPPPPPPPSPHTLLFVRKGLPTSRPTLHRGGKGGASEYCSNSGKKHFVPHTLARIVALANSLTTPAVYCTTTITNTESLQFKRANVTSNHRGNLVD